MFTRLVSEDFKRIAPLIEKKCADVLQQFLPEGGVLSIKEFSVKTDIRSQYSISACIQNSGNKEISQFFISANRNEVEEFLQEQFGITYPFQEKDQDLALDFIGELANILNGKIIEQGFFKNLFGEQNPSPPIYISSSFYQKGVWSVQGEFYASSMKLLVGFATAHNRLSVSEEVPAFAESVL